MFGSIPQPVEARMRYLEGKDACDREDGTPRLERLRQITRETAKFIALLAAMAPEGTCLEIGTSAGYSTLWLALACRQQGRRVITFEVLPEKAELAGETFRRAGLQDAVELIVGDAREHLARFDDVAFCFLDAEKEIYAECYEQIVPRMVPGGLLVADNAISHQEALQSMLDRAMADERVDALILPIGRGELLCRKL